MAGSRQGGNTRDHVEEHHSGTDMAHRDSSILPSWEDRTPRTNYRVEGAGGRGGAPGSAAVTWEERPREMLLNPPPFFFYIAYVKIK